MTGFDDMTKELDVENLMPAASGASQCLVCGEAYGPCKLPGLKRCVECGFITADLALSDDELAALYGEDYFHGEEYRHYVSEEASLKDNFRRRLKTLHELIPGMSRLNLFEIGCAYGFFLDEVRQDVASAKGIDISADATRYARETKKVDAITGSFSDYAMGPGIGLVTMWDTIEHLPHPDAFIEKVGREIDRGGYISITTGDIDSLNARMRGKHLRNIHPPTHIHYVSLSTPTNVFDPSRFDVVHVSHPGNARDLRSILHFILDIRLGWGGLYRRIAGWPIFNVSLTMNLFDIMFVVAKRRPE